MDKFAAYMDTLSARHERNRVFNDFLNIVFCCLSMGQQEDLYFKTIKKYNSKELDVFVQAFAALVIEMDNDGEGLVDVLGDYFEEHFHNEKLGQFFTPPSICELMTAIIACDKDMYDPCCGSGRYFLASAKRNRDVTFYGGDISETCCKMTLINMCLNGLKCRISWMDSLNMDVFEEWGVLIHPVKMCPYIFEIKEDVKVLESVACEDINEIVESPVAEVVKKNKFRKFSA